MTLTAIPTCRKNNLCLVQSSSIFSSFKKITLLIYFWLCWVFVALWALLQLRQMCRLLLAEASVVWSTSSRHSGFSSCDMWAQQLWGMNLFAPQHVGSSQTRDQTCDSCIGRQILLPLSHQVSPYHIFSLDTFILNMT